MLGRLDDHVVAELGEPAVERGGLEHHRAHRVLYDAQVTAELMRQVITGEFREQRARLDVCMPRRKTMERALTVTVGAVSAGLEALRQSLLASEQCAFAAAVA